MYLVFFSWRLWMSYITITQNKSSSNLEPKHTLLPVSCRHLRPSISFALVLIFLFSRPPHLILLSTLTNPIFIFNLKISSYNPIFFCFHRIIEPLTSRCSKFRFKPLSTETLEKRLNMICKEENVNCDNKVWKDDLFWKWLKISTGGFNNSAAQIRLHFDLSSWSFIIFFIQAIHELIKISEGDMRKVCKTRDNSLVRISFF